MKARKLSKMTIERFMPDRKCLDRLGHAYGQSIASANDMAKVFPTWDVLFGYSLGTLDTLLGRPTMKCSAPTRGRVVDQYHSYQQDFCLSVLRGARDYLYGDISEEVGMDLNKLAGACYPFEATPSGTFQFSVYAWDFMATQEFEAFDLKPNVWAIQGNRTDVPDEPEFYAIMAVTWPYVGPCVLYWNPSASTDGLTTLLNVLREAFGDCAGLELSAWKVEQCKLDRQAQAA